MKTTTTTKNNKIPQEILINMKRNTTYTNQHQLNTNQRPGILHLC